MKNFFKKTLSIILKSLAIAVLRKYKPKIIAITGSVGKTSTKDAVYAVLSKISYVRKSQKSYNSQIGLPLTILGVSNAWNNPIGWMENILKGLYILIFPIRYPKWLVLEVGVGKPGDMKDTASWLKTDAVIITAIGDTPAHIEFFESREHLIEEKAGLIKTLKPDGLLILNKDDAAVRKMKEGLKHRVITFGFEPPADVLGSVEGIAYTNSDVPEGIIFRADAEGKSLPVTIDGVFGRNHIYASLAAIALALGFKWNMLTAVDALKSYEVPPGRMRLLKGVNSTLIIDDTYNSSPYACESALRTLGEVKGKRKIAVLGDMLELGKHTEEAHKNIGKLAYENAEILLVVGPRSKFIKEGAILAGMGEKNIFEFPNSYKAGDFLKNFIKPRDLVLIKGSQGMRMERVVEAIMQDKKNKHKLLVRQDREWLLKA